MLVPVQAAGLHLLGKLVGQVGHEVRHGREDFELLVLDDWDDFFPEVVVGRLLLVLTFAAGVTGGVGGVPLPLAEFGRCVQSLALRALQVEVGVV